MVTQNRCGRLGAHELDKSLNIDGTQSESTAVFTINFMVKPNEQLVTVSSTCYHASTSVLSNRLSSCALIRYLNLGRSHLGEGFTLICIQRLS